jgi:hypothetical protein
MSWIKFGGVTRRVRIRRVVCLVRFLPMREGGSSNRRLRVGNETSGGDTRVLEDVSAVVPFQQRSFSL